ncbi:hypothetical protein GMA11_08505 [Granulicatella sp. zg-ZJ]|uniref:hypothetical protein n=1 Tax=Granulicatella sp. zg-ZJ TaxID=2678504 RepID=UPI0013D3B453|nr:hypothetical protein [Granulicatella sp. zg-ZJ]NEW63419.1 hypothetical protein [Granulicatella sp. zg-ZJ]
MNSTFAENTTKDILTEKVDSRDKTKKLSGAFLMYLPKNEKVIYTIVVFNF